MNNRRGTTIGRGEYDKSPMLSQFLQFSGSCDSHRSIGNNVRAFLSVFTLERFHLLVCRRK